MDYLFYNFMRKFPRVEYNCFSRLTVRVIRRFQLFTVHESGTVCPPVSFFMKNVAINYRKQQVKVNSLNFYLSDIKSGVETKQVMEELFLLLLLICIYCSIIYLMTF